MSKEGFLKVSKRPNALSVAVAFALTGLIVFYLPDEVERPFNWKSQGHLIGLVLAVLGIFAVLMSARKITNRDSFVSWAAAVVAASGAFTLLAVTRNVSIPRWLAVAFLVLSVAAIVIAIYALVLGFTQLFDANLARNVSPPRSTGASAQGGSSERQQATDAGRHRRLNWYEWVTLAVATVAAVATVVAAVASYIPRSPS